MQDKTISLLNIRGRSRLVDHGWSVDGRVMVVNAAMTVESVDGVVVKPAAIVAVVWEVSTVSTTV